MRPEASNPPFLGPFTPIGAMAGHFFLGAFEALNMPQMRLKTRF